MTIPLAPNYDHVDVGPVKPCQFTSDPYYQSHCLHHLGFVAVNLNHDDLGVQRGVRGHAIMKITFLRASFVRVLVLAVGLILSGQNGFAGGYTNNFSSGIGSTVTGGSAAIVGGTLLELTPKAASTYGTLLVNDLDPGVAIQSFTVTFDLYIYSGGDLGGDGLSLNFGNPTNYPNGYANYELGVGAGLNFRFQTYTVNRTSLGMNSAGLAVSTPYTDVGNGSTDPMTISYDRVSGATFNYRGQTISLTAVQLGGFVPQPGFRFLLGARCGGATEGHRIDNLSITTIPQSTNASLAGIVPSVGALTPIFSGNTTSYTVNVAYAVTNFSVSPTVAQSNATITVNGVTVVSGAASGNSALNVGTNLQTIVVTAENR
ncbi:MAG: pknD 3, partial [Verrucomicrobiales bacterium]|nr:pknD 3 [Verrucomicrobiales bacterium]